MNKNQIKDRIKKLNKLIKYHRVLYYTLDAPKISDSVFDSLERELADLEKKYPKIATSKSITQEVGDKPLDKFKKLRHKVPMLSFNNAFSNDEMKQWVERLEKYLGFNLWKESLSPIFYCELKFDGLSIELVYDNGELVSGVTRGDGVIGEDVTQNIMTVKDVPHTLTKLDKWDVPKHLIVRGEVFIDKKEFDEINLRRKKLGKEEYSNPRNLAAGSIRQLDSNIARERKLRMFVYDIMGGAPEYKKHEEKHLLLASWGLPVNTESRGLNTLEDVFRFHGYQEKKRNKLSYEVDGVVVLINDEQVFSKAGFVGKSPRGGIAYKFLPIEAVTIIKDIKIQVGRTGVLTPVALLNPVEIGGSIVSRSTLHNFDEIDRLDIRIGDTVVVTRSGDVIPKIIRVLKELRPLKSSQFKIPVVCPFDGVKLVRDGVYIKCSSKNCGSINKNKIKHFVSRDAFNINGLGPKIIDKFLDEGMVSDFSDIFFLRVGDVEVLERFGVKSASNLVREIKNSKEISIERFLYAIGILHVGVETAKTMAKIFVAQNKNVKIEEIVNFFNGMSIDKLEELEDIGPVVAKSIKGWFSDGRNIKIMDNLSTAGIRLLYKKRFLKNLTMSGMGFVITGVLKNISRQKAKDMIEDKGGSVNSSVSSKTDVLVVGENPGSKYNKAIKLDIDIWDEDRLFRELEK